mgnify:FL=1|tara:strand:+ start:133 stop:438 length:306 start_codon:yes stop_codon:yes gene_type:complete
MSKNNYLISKKAVEDLENIWLFTLKKWSVEQADRYYKLIIDEIIFTSDNYLTGKSIDNIRKGYRVTKIKSHLIFYKKTDNGLMEVIRILHQRMDIKSRLKK